MGRLSKRDALLLEALFCALPLVYYLLRLPSMPETVPVHWNDAGEATRYAARFSFDTILSCFIGYMGLLLGRGLRAVSSDKKSENHAAVERIMAWNEALLIITLLPLASPNASLISTAAALVIPVILIAAYRPK
uniref:DUF1648 domain-containing protein n=1 Tax=Candidatus Scatomorpha intestinigallinarum TaxID=2840923 RepID=UPI004027B996